MTLAAARDLSPHQALWLWRHSEQQCLADALLNVRVAHAANAPAAYTQGQQFLARFERELLDALENLSGF